MKLYIKLNKMLIFTSIFVFIILLICPFKSFAKETTYSNSYGNQLTTTSKKIYNQLVQHFYKEKKTNSFTPNTNISVDFVANLNKNGSLNKNSRNYKKAYSTLFNDYIYARDAFFEDYPEVFWLYNVAFKVDVKVYATTSSKYTSGYKGVLSISSIYPYTNNQTKSKNQGEIFPGASKLIKNYDQGVSKAVKEIKKSTNNTTDSATIYQAINNYLCKKVTYDYIAANHLTNTSYLYAHTSANAFISTPYNKSKSSSRLMVCDGYSKAFKVLCDALGLRNSCAIVSGKTTSGNHEWNYVKINKKWYLVDVTWNDISATNKYLLIGSKNLGANGISIQKERKAYNYFNNTSAIFSLPKLSSTSYLK
jgi:hypothetical protein